MSETDDTTLTQDDEDAHVGIPRKDLRALRERSRKYDEAEKRAQEAERKLAFAQAGIDLSDKRAGFFVKGYDGEATPEAIRASWEDAFGTGQAQPHAEELAAQERVAQATSGAETRPPAPTAEFYDRLRQAKNDREADLILAEARAAGLHV